MNVGDFRKGFPGSLVEIPGGVFAFVPNPLPPHNLEFSLELINRLSEADRALGELKGAGYNLSNPHLMIGPLKTREAILSSKLEGTIATAKDLMLYEAEPGSISKGGEVREVWNYIDALDYGLDRLKTLPISKRFIAEVHEKLLDNVRGREHQPGKYRRIQNAIGIKDQAIENVRFLPPPVIEMNNALDDFEKYLHQQHQIPHLVNLAIIHYQFEAIHPFMDGNGRIGRLLIILLLCEWEVLDSPLLYISSYLEKNKSDYKDLLLAVSQEGAWQNWITFFLRGICEQSKDTIKRSNKLIFLKEKYRKQMQTLQASTLPLILIDELFNTPWTNTKRATALLRTTPRTAQSIIDKLVESNILAEATGQARKRIYIAGDIIDLIETDELDD